MAGKDRRVDAYIKRAAPFARPILKHLRKVVHAGCPDVEETIKWNSPFFEHKGIICFMAAFKQHCVFGFWKGALGHFGRITSINDLAGAKTLTGYVRKAAELNEAGVRKSRPRSPAKQKVSVLPDLKGALQKNAKARKTFENFSYSHKKEYVDWIADAKRDETRKRRLQTAIEWLAEGKPQNWKYL